MHIYCDPICYLVRIGEIFNDKGKFSISIFLKFKKHIEQGLIRRYIKGLVFLR